MAGDTGMSFTTTILRLVSVLTMQNDLKEYLASQIATDSMAELCRSLNEIGPYVSDLSFADPLTVGRLTSYVTMQARRSAYRQFHIPKKSGGVRVITAPDGELKDILTTLAFIFSECYVPTPNAMAFTCGRSVADNARAHVGHHYVLNLDLKDFFTTITAMDVERGLNRIGISPLVSRDLATICTYPVSDGQRVRNVLPQGSPASPVLSNICSMTLDRRLEGLARRFHLTYTRYADDMTFSSNNNVYHEDGDFMRELHHIVSECGFTVNPSKTRLQKRGARQEVTGLNVGERVNVSRHYVKTLRAIIHHIAINDHPTKHEVCVAKGKLNYLRMVKGKHDSTYITLLVKLKQAVAGKKLAMSNP